MSLTVEEQILRIRSDSERYALSIRSLARKHRVGRRFVRRALASPIPVPRKVPERDCPVLGPYHAVIDHWLREDLDAPAKQRHTLVRITARLAEEHGCTASYGTVRSYVSRRRPQIESQAGLIPGPRNGYIPRHYDPGQDAEVDFGDLWVRLDGGETVKCYLFVLRLGYSGRAIHRVYATCAQEAFLDGHVHAFRALGGMPRGHIRYDNLTPAVEKVMFRSRERVENPRWQAFHQHYGFEPWYCEPGLRGAHEKGGVEGEVGYFRRNYLSPVPRIADLDALNEMIEGWERRELGRRIGARARSIGQELAEELPALRPLPTEPFDTRLLLTPVVDRYSMITVRQNKYSVPARLIGRRVRVMLGATDLIVYQGGSEILRHPRLIARGGEVAVLDHYLEILLAKPGALAGSRALEAARQTGAFTALHERYWARAQEALGEKQGTRALIQILLLHRHMHTADVLAGISAALTLGTPAPDLVALEARKNAQADGRAPTVTAPPGEFHPLPIAHRQGRTLPADTRPLPVLTAYDDLLRLPREPASCPPGR